MLGDTTQRTLSFNVDWIGTQHILDVVFTKCRATLELQAGHLRNLGLSSLLIVLNGGQGEPGGSEGVWLDLLHEQAVHRQPNQHFSTEVSSLPVRQGCRASLPHRSSC